ncbi:hypothetical protein LWI29_016398 [Acer saccharum]|uniref:Uncharacterized protein n=1 Tax=Acer saccharum TaxID=4024 RepID=A0AA39SJ46_ACESA|nr:hypothetical protein LWI29_016398 [Acer saccharum]
MEGVGNHAEGVKAPGPGSGSDTNIGDIGTSGLKTDTYGPWMQVSYRRNGKMGMGATSGGKKASDMGSMGKVSSDTRFGGGPPMSGSDTRFGGGPPMSGGDVSGKGVGNRKETIKPYVAKNGRKMGNYVKEGNNNLGGSRFAILSEEVMEGPGTTGVHIPKKHTLVPVTTVLTDISNKTGNRKNLVPSLATKYLGTATSNKSHHSVSSKEYRGGGITPGCTVGSIKGKQTTVELEEDLEDSEVLKLLHKDMMDTVITATVAPSTGIVGCSSGPGEGSSNSSVILDGSVDLVPAQLVDVSAAKDLDVVASSLSLPCITNYDCIPRSFPCLEDSEIADLSKAVSEEESLPFLVLPGKPTLIKIKILQFSRSLKKLDENNTNNNIISRDGLNNVATWVSTTVISALFVSLERCACVYLTTFELDDDEEESKDRPLVLSAANPLFVDDIINFLAVVLG